MDRWNRPYLRVVSGPEPIAMKSLLLIGSLLLCGLNASAQVPAQQTYHANGRLESTRYSEGGMERFITYYESGRVKEMGAFRHGRRHGAWKQFDENGSLRAEAHFTKGQRDGEWLFRDGANVLRGRLRYCEGALREGAAYEAGELVALRSY